MTREEKQKAIDVLKISVPIIPVTQEEFNNHIRTLHQVMDWLEQEPKTGHWIYDDECHEHGHCSECGYGRVDLVNGEPHNFCRRCGVKMVEPQEEREE